MNDIQLYDYQLQMLHDIEKILAEPSCKSKGMRGGHEELLGRSVMVQMPTGTGKTFVMAAVIQKVKVDGGIWVIAHRRELVEQMKDTLAHFGIAHEGCGGINDRGSAKVRVMSVQWLTRNIEKIKEKEKPGLIIIDEAHHSIAQTYQQMWTSFPQTLKLGFTATPCRLKATSFSTLYDTLLTSWSIRRFIREGRLSLYDYVVINKDSDTQRTIDNLGKRGADGDYSTSEMNEKLNVDSSIITLFNSVNRFAHGKKGIVYAICISHAQRIAEYYKSRGLNAVAIDSKTPAADRKMIVEYFKQGHIDCLVNVNLFDEGFDCPDIEYIQLARPTLSLSKYLQMVGRGLRVHPDKKTCVLIDNVGLYRMFGPPDAERNWIETFNGKSAVRGKQTRNRKTYPHMVNNDMEVVVNHGRLLPKTETEELAFTKNTVPFEKEGLWGLRSGDEIVLRPMYKMIKPFVGEYCAYSIADSRWGILTRTGMVVISPDFVEINIQQDGFAILKKGNLLYQKINIQRAEQEALIIKSWWKHMDDIAKKLSSKKPFIRR